ncbi:hypothetical protein QJS10_CPA03g01919 [Acorus calamus]|uniref:Uncharacterized protein n=1 Tax=Acorus calamus TaxID=4465 RepID=A0AAV9F683_ACOCL|nr:hypothetical protein QJS10_CPA03g01919 [Acorus calamus]
MYFEREIEWLIVLLPCNPLLEPLFFSLATSLQNRSSSSSRLRAGLGIRLSVQFVRVDSRSPASIHPYPGEPVPVSLSSTVFRRLGSSPSPQQGSSALSARSRCGSLVHVGSSTTSASEAKDSSSPTAHSFKWGLSPSSVIVGTSLVGMYATSGRADLTHNEEVSQGRLSMAEKWPFSTSM